jgi:hypothetical protein
LLDVRGTRFKVASKLENLKYEVPVKIRVRVLAGMELFQVVIRKKKNIEVVPIKMGNRSDVFFGCLSHKNESQRNKLG